MAETERVPGLSLVVPARDEELRLPRTLAAASRALPGLAAESEIVVVDDGSRDATADVAEGFAGPVPVRVVGLSENRGKGAAVAAGIAAARHPLVAFTDADCPYDLESLRPMLAALARGTADVAIGARELPESQVNRGYGLVRLVSGKLFSLFTWLAIGLPFRDSQCGLKAFRTDAARALFAVRTVDRFGFDFEVLAAALANGLVVERFPVRLTHDDDSRIDLVRDSLEMARDLVRVRRRLRAGAYRFSGSAGQQGEERCPLCGDAGFRPRVERAGHRMVECSACGLWYLRPMPTRAALERFYGADYYASEESCSAGYGDYAALADDLRATFRRRLALVTEVPPSARLLDVGGGYGYLADAAAADGRFRERWVVEASGDAAARVAGGHRVVVGWFPDVALPDGFFDVVSLQDCLEHLPDPRAALARARDVLRAGGVLILTTPNTRSWLARLQGRRWLSLKFPEHVVLFSRDSLARALGEAGFRVERMESARQVARVDFVLSRLFAGRPRLVERALAVARALGVASRGLAVPSGSLTVVARVDENARAARAERHACTA
ncbi:MAG TPA: bifunctional glycosyltransferase/class I SAM-dependent methyltransferase [Candidatus Binatia bacterium]|nr:bifunctional glycosyltransferase/class I SAM-dependent methyltransferase [Candidatus Binatia bacterium]